MVNKLEKVSILFYTLLFSAIFLCCIPLWLQYGIWIGFAPLFILFWIGAWRLTARFTTLQIRVLAGGLLAFWLIIGSVTAFLLMVEPAWDFGRVYNAALEICQYGTFISPTHTEYFLRYPHNYLILVVSVLWFKGFSLFGVTPLHAGIVLNISAVGVSLAFLFFAVREWYNDRIAVFVLFIGLFFSPVWLYLPIFYTDTLSIPFPILALWIAGIAAKQKKGTKKTWLGIFTGVCVAVGFLLKATVVITLAAIVVGFLITKVKDEFLYLLGAVVGFVGVLVIWQIVLHLIPWVNFSNKSNYQFPATHFVMMGLKDTGGYSPEDEEFTAGFTNIQERETANLDEIKQRIAQYGLFGMLVHLQEKMAYTWSDGTYFAPKKLSIDPVFETKLQQWVLPGGKYYSSIEGILAAFQAAVLALFVFNGVWMLGKKNHEFDLLYVSCIAVTGLAIFLLVWETRSRYLVNYIPMFAIIAAHGIIHIDAKIVKRKHGEKIVCTEQKQIGN